MTNAAADAPLYMKVKDHVLAHVASGRWPASARVPSENELVRDLKVSRMTAHRAMKELCEEGVLVRIQGLGTFVSDHPARAHPLELKNIAEDIRARGHSHAIEVLATGKVAASADEAAQLDVKPGTLLFHSRVLHFEDGVPLQLEDRLVNPAAAPHYLEQDFTHMTPGAYLLQVAPLQQVEHTVRAIMPDAVAGQYLQMKAGEPCLLIIRRTWAEGRVAALAHLIHPGSRYELAGRFKP